MALSLVLLIGFLAVVCAQPVLYKLNDNDKLEPDLVPVSSTVIPLPIYKVETSVSADAGHSTLVKPPGPIKLVTVHRNKHVSKKNLKDNVASS